MKVKAGKKFVTITINWNCEQSIKLAEKLQESLINKGYNQVGTQAGFTTTKIFFSL